jgi:hypothetical protein
MSEPAARASHHRHLALQAEIHDAPSCLAVHASTRSS